MNVLTNAIDNAIAYLRAEDLDLSLAQHLTPAEVIVLATLNESVRYTYEIIDLIPCNSEGRKLVKVGTIYPTISLLKKKGLINARRDKETANMLRVYYSLSEKGKASLVSHMIDLLTLFNA